MFLQFELWKDCNHNCAFCCNREIPYERDKVESLLYVKNILQTEKGPCDSISLIGGEFFDGQLSDPTVNKLFYDVVLDIILRIKAGKTSRGLICTSLMYGDTTEWDRFCSFLKKHGVTNRFLVCTSWDIVYRFNQDTLNNWQRNMEALHRYYPEMPIHVEMIMTQGFILNYLSGDLSIREFENTWHCTLDFNTPFKCLAKYTNKEDMNGDLPLFFPKRKDFFKFLSIANSRSDVDLTQLQNVVRHSTCLHYTINDKDQLVLSDRHSERHTCIRPGPCQGCCCGYIDSSKKMHEDIKDFLEASA